MNGSGQHPYYPGLDLIRFCAAGLVIMVHYGLIASGQVSPSAAAYIIRHSWFGWAGVQVFFVLSGFVIANSASSESVTAFLKSRILRLYPGAWICATLSALSLWLIGGTRPPTLLIPYVSSLFLLPKYMIDVVYWTLPVEIAFYAVVTLLLLSRRFYLLPVLAGFLTIYGGAFVTFAILPHMGFRFPQALTDVVLSHKTTDNILLLRHGCFFAVGIWLWLLTKRRTATRLMGLLVAMGFGVVEILLSSFETSSWQKAVGPEGYWMPVTAWLLALLGMVCAIRFSRYRRPSGRFTAVLRTMGLMTYPLYLLHLSVGNTIASFLIGKAAMPLALAIAFGLATSLGLSWTICRYGEPKIRARFGPILDRALKYA